MKSDQKQSLGLQSLRSYNRALLNNACMYSTKIEITGILFNQPRQNYPSKSNSRLTKTCRNSPRPWSKLRSMEWAGCSL